MGTDDTNRQGRKRIEELLDGMWPKDPLRENITHPENFGNEMIEIGDYFDGVSRDQNILFN